MAPVAEVSVPQTWLGYAGFFADQDDFLLG